MTARQNTREIQANQILATRQVQIAIRSSSSAPNTWSLDYGKSLEPIRAALNDDDEFEADVRLENANPNSIDLRSFENPH